MTVWTLYTVDNRNGTHYCIIFGLIFQLSQFHAKFPRQCDAIILQIDSQCHYPWSVPDYCNLQQVRWQSFLKYIQYILIGCWLVVVMMQTLFILSNMAKIATHNALFQKSKLINRAFRCNQSRGISNLVRFVILCSFFDFHFV